MGLGELESCFGEKYILGQLAHQALRVQLDFCLTSGLGGLPARPPILPHPPSLWWL